VKKVDGVPSRPDNHKVGPRRSGEEEMEKLPARHGKTSVSGTIVNISESGLGSSETN